MGTAGIKCEDLRCDEVVGRVAPSNCLESIEPAERGQRDRRYHDTAYHDGETGGTTSTPSRRALLTLPVLSSTDPGPKSADDRDAPPLCPTEKSRQPMDMRKLCYVEAVSEYSPARYVEAASDESPIHVVASSIQAGTDVSKLGSRDTAAAVSTGAAARAGHGSSSASGQPASLPMLPRRTAPSPYDRPRQHASLIVTLVKPAGGRQGVGLGAKFLPDSLMVSDVIPGSLLDDYNRSQGGSHPDSCVRVGDIVVRINDVEGNPRAMVRECMEASNLVLAVHKVGPSAGSPRPV